MAVKQKVVDCLPPSNTEACLQMILRDLQNVTSQAQDMQDKICIQIVISLGNVIIPTDPQSYIKFILDIKKVQDMLIKQCLNDNMIFITLKTLYNEISKGDRYLSPAMSIVLQLIEIDCIPRAVDLILQNGYNTQSLKNALSTLCLWLTKWTLTENLGPLILAFMQGLEKQQHYEILNDVTMATIEPLFPLLVVPDPRKNIGPVVLYILTIRELCVDAFHKILPHISKVIICLEKENSECSLHYLNEIVKICVELMEYLPQNSNLYMQLNNDLQTYLPMNRTLTNHNDKIWLNNINSSISIQTTIGKVGLNNLGNTCYVNSVLQALFMTKDFRNEILLHASNYNTIHNNNNINSNNLVMWMQILFALLQYSKRSSLSPSEILNIVRPPGFLPGQQHDSSEFLGYLLDMLHEKEKQPSNNTETSSSSSLTSSSSSSTSSSTPSSPSSSTPSTIVQRVFGGRTISISSCRQCGMKSDRADNFRDLQLSFPNNSDNNQSVQMLLDYYLQPEKLNGDNQYHCDKCQGLTDGERVTSIEVAPRRLILTLKHFRYDPASQQRTKLLQTINLDHYINLNDCQYILYAAVVHCGSSVDSGHYYTYANDGDDWYKFNDGFVTRTNFNELCGLKPPETPYILFYRRDDCIDPENLHCEHLPNRLQIAIDKHNEEFEIEKRRRPIKNYNIRQNRNDEPPPPGCGGGGFTNNSANMFVC